MNVKPRERLEDGIVDTMNKLIQVFHSDDQEIKNPDPSKEFDYGP